MRRHRPIAFCHRCAPDNWDRQSSKLGERRTLMEGDMVRLAALDLVLRIVCARMMGIAFDLELASMHADDRAADAPRLGIPAHAIMDLEGLRHGRSVRCHKRTAGGNSRIECTFTCAACVATAAVPDRSTRSQYLSTNAFGPGSTNRQAQYRSGISVSPIIRREYGRAPRGHYVGRRGYDDGRGFAVGSDGPVACEGGRENPVRSRAVAPSHDRAQSWTDCRSHGARLRVFSFDGR